jgi:hypothetical protein
VVLPLPFAPNNAVNSAGLMSRSSWSIIRWPARSTHICFN